jgi:hypothetical protein
LSKKSRKHRVGLCFYCGQPAELTVDHVVPECLFGGKAPKDVPKVPACATCNNVEKSGDDSYLRDLLVSDLHTSLSPRVRQLFDGPFLRAAGRNQSTLAPIVLKASPVDVVTPSGLIIGIAYGVMVPDNRISYILARMVRGLYHHYVGQHIGVELPPQSRFMICRKYDLDVVRTDVQVIQQLVAVGALKGGTARVADGAVFQCQYAYDQDMPEKSVWYLNFFYNAVGGAFFFVATNGGTGVATVVA